MPGGDEGSAISLDDPTVRKLASKIAGRVIAKDAPDYESSRRVFDLAFRRPDLIVRCPDASDVARSLDFAQTGKLSLGVAWRRA
jgi:hypothetical protein